MIQVTLDKDGGSIASEILGLVARVVSLTYGPNGSLVAITKDNKTSVTKDGVTVLKSLSSDTPFETAILDIIKEASINTMSRAGDGTTATIVLSNAFIKNKCNLSSANNFVQRAKSFLKDLAVIDLSRDMIKRVALTSTNWDEELAECITEAFEYSDAQSVVATPNFGGSTEVNIADEININALIASPEFIDDYETSETAMKDPKIIVTLSQVEGESDLIDMIDKLIEMEEENIVILMPKADVRSVAALRVNHTAGVIRILPVLVGSGIEENDTLYDISVAVGAEPFGDMSGLSLKDITPERLGEAEEVIYTKGKLIIKNPKGDPKKREKLAAAHLEKAEKEQVEYRKEILRRRASLVKGKTIEVKVGGENQKSIMERKDRADDAIQAVKNSLKYGVLPGGGMAYAYLAQQPFAKDFRRALMEPLTILSKKKDIPLNFELFKEPVAYSFEHGVVGISSENAPLDSYKTVINVIEQSIELAKLIKSIKATVINKGEENGNR